MSCNPEVLQFTLSPQTNLLKIHCRRFLQSHSRIKLKSIHVKGHFVMCYLALSMIRYLQYLMGEEGWKEILSAEEIMTALRKPQVVVQGAYPDVIATPINVSQEYLDLARLLKMKELRQNMTLTQFRSATKLDLNKNLSRI